MPTATPTCGNIREGNMFKIGDKILTWFSDREDGMSIIVDIQPYTGKYPELYDVVLEVTAPGTPLGTVKICEKSNT